MISPNQCVVCTAINRLRRRCGQVRSTSLESTGECGPANSTERISANWTATRQNLIPPGTTTYQVYQAQQGLGDGAQDLRAEVCRELHAETEGRIWRYLPAGTALASVLCTSLHDLPEWVLACCVMPSGDPENLPKKQAHGRALRVKSLACPSRVRSRAVARADAACLGGQQSLPRTQPQPVPAVCAAQHRCALHGVPMLAAVFNHIRMR